MIFTQIEELLECNRTYEVIYTDPPWNQHKGGGRKSRPNQGRQLDYSTLSIEEIGKIHQQVMALECVNCNVFMWTIDKFLHQSEQMMKNLGYELHARFIWDKTNGVAPAFTVRFSHEYLLWFYHKGHMLMPITEMRGKYTTVFREASTKHSKKPECAYQMIESMFPNSSKLEMFARSTRSGWDSFGNELPKNFKNF